MRIKCVVKNVIIFDLIFDTDQKQSKSNFSCSSNSYVWGLHFLRLEVRNSYVCGIDFLRLVVDFLRFEG